MKRRPPSQIQPASVKVDNRGQQYLVYPDGQTRRMARNGTPLPRVKMSKKERLKLRREYQEAKELDRKALADKILNAPVVNPVIKPVPEQRGLPAEKPEAGAKDACVI